MGYDEVMIDKDETGRYKLSQTIQCYVLMGLTVCQPHDARRTGHLPEVRKPNSSRRRQVTRHGQNNSDNTQFTSVPHQRAALAHRTSTPHQHAVPRQDPPVFPTALNSPPLYSSLSMIPCISLLNTPLLSDTPFKAVP